MNQEYKEYYGAGVKAEFRPVVFSKKAIECRIGAVVIGLKIGTGKFYKRPEFICFGSPVSLKVLLLCKKELVRKAVAGTRQLPSGNVLQIH